MNIEFIKLGKLSDLIIWENKPNNPGIYMWIERFANKNIINYIGKAEVSVYRRNRHHFENIVNGTYPVPLRYFESLNLSPEKLKMFEYSKTRKTSKSNDRTLHIYSDISLLKLFLDSSFKYRDNITVFYSPVIESTSLNDIEAKIINLLNPEENLTRPHHGNIEVMNILIEGLPHSEFILNIDN